MTTIVPPPPKTAMVLLTAGRLLNSLGVEELDTAVVFLSILMFSGFVISRYPFSRYSSLPGSSVDKIHPTLP
jgi:hypothetical protein